MTLQAAYREDLRELVATLDDRGIFRLGEHEAWEEGIDEADKMSGLMMTGEALHEAMIEQEGVDEAVIKHTEERTEAFV